MNYKPIFANPCMLAPLIHLTFLKGTHFGLFSRSFRDLGWALHLMAGIGRRPVRLKVEHKGEIARAWATCKFISYACKDHDFYPKSRYKCLESLIRAGGESGEQQVGVKSRYTKLFRRQSPGRDEGWPWLSRLLHSEQVTYIISFNPHNNLKCQVPLSSSFYCWEN